MLHLLEAHRVYHSHGGGNGLMTTIMRAVIYSAVWRFMARLPMMLVGVLFLLACVGYLVLRRRRT
jgi:hypothetical protein